jgi:hypothetical protein
MKLRAELPSLKVDDTSITKTSELRPDALGWGYHFRVTCTDDHTRYELSEHVKSVRNLYQLVEEAVHKAVEFYERLG